MASRETLLAILASVGLPSFASAQFVPGDIYIDAVDQIFHVDPNNWSVSVFADDSDGLNDAGWIAFTRSDTLLCSNYKTSEVFEFDSVGTSTVLYDAADGVTGPCGLAFDATGNLLVADGQQILSFPAGGGAATVFSDSSNGFFLPGDVAVARNGSALVTDWYPGSVWLIDSSGNATVFDSLPLPATIAIRDNGDIYIAANSTQGEGIYRYPLGDVAQRVLLAEFPGAWGWGAVQLSLDQKTVYFASWDELYAVDADSGATTKVIDNSKGLVECWSISVVRPRAAWSNYGAGFSGSNGVPAFTSQANPVLGTTVTLDLTNSFGQPTIGLLFAGFQQASIHSAWGGDLLVAPVITLPLTFSYGFDSFSCALPGDPLLAGTKLELQAIEADPGAAKGVSFTQGLELVLGY